MKALFLIAILALARPVLLHAADDAAIAAAVKKGDACDEQLKTRASLDAYLDAEKMGGKDANLLRKISREYALMMPDVAGKDEKRAFGEKALGYARRAVEADSQNATAHLALAICYGRLAPLMDNKTKIAYSKLVREEVERSIALDAGDDYAYHVLGAWNYEMASLNPVLRGIAKLIYGTLPAASYEEAEKNLKKAVSIAPERVSHHVELGRTYAAMRKEDLARAELTKGLSLPSKEKDDGESKARAKAALEGL
jgi:hypothetical protein